MNNYTTIDALEDWGRNMANHLRRISEKSPLQTDDYLSPNMREETRQECLEYFGLPPYDTDGIKDKVGISIWRAFNGIWGKLPKRITTFEEYAAAMRVLYIVCCQSEFAMKILELASIDSAEMEKPQTLRWRNGRQDDYGDRMALGWMTDMGRSFARLTCEMPDAKFHSERYAMLLRRLQLKPDYLKVTGLKYSKKKDDRRLGFIGGVLLPAAEQKNEVQTAFFDSQEIPINLHACHVNEFQVRALAFKLFQVKHCKLAAVAIIRKVLRDFPEHALELMYEDNIPQR